MAEFVGEVLDTRSGKNVAANSAFKQPPLRLEIRVQRAVAFEMVLGKIGPQRGVGAEVAECLGLERAHFANRDRIGRAAVAVGDEPGERIADVARRVGVAIHRTQRMGEEFGEGCLAVGAGDGDQRTAPEERCKIQFGQTHRAGGTRLGDPRMRGGEARRIYDKRMSTGGGAAKPGQRAVRAVLIEDHAGAAELGDQFGHGVTAHSAAENGDGAGKQGFEEFGNDEGHQRSFKVPRPARAHMREMTQKRRTTFVSGQPVF